MLRIFVFPPSKQVKAATTAHFPHSWDVYGKHEDSSMTRNSSVSIPIAIPRCTLYKTNISDFKIKKGVDFIKIILN